MHALISNLLAGLILFGLVSTGAAQDADEEVKVAVVLIPEDGAGLAEQTLVSMGLRRGIRANDSLDDEHPADVLTREQPDYIYSAAEEPDAIAELLGAGEAREAEERARSVLEIFEENLDLVKRSMLADTYALLGVAQCLQRRRQECQESFGRVVAFREHFFYDPERYPPQFEDTFNNVQMEAVDNGIRGSIEVLTEPEGAEVFVDGRSYGPSPVVVEGILVGDHYVTVKAIGYEKQIIRATVEEEFQGTVEVPLETSPQSLLITQAMDNIPPELGEPRAGDAISSLGTNLFVDQAVVGTVSSAGEGTVRVQLYLYDLRTKFLLARQEGEISSDSEGSEAAEAMLAELYDGVDLTGQVEAPDLGPNFEEGTPFWKTWWFWSIVGVVVVGAVVIGVAASQSGPEQLPAGWYQTTGSIESP